MAALLCLPVILGTAHLTAASVLDKRDFNYINQGRLSFADLLALVYPSTSGSLIYLGTSLVGLAAIGLCFRIRQPLTIISLALAALGVLMAIGDNTPLLKWASVVFPPIRFFRLPFRYLYLTQVAVAVLAAFGADELLARRKHRYWAHVVNFALLGVSATLWMNYSQVHHATHVDLTRDMANATLWLGLIVVASVVGSIRRLSAWSAFALAFVVLADFEQLVPHTQVLRDGAFELPRNITRSTLATIEQQSSQYRVWDEFGLGFRAGSRLGLRDLRGYMDPLRLADYETMASQLSYAPELLERWGVRWALSADHPYVGGGHKRANLSRLRTGTWREPHVYELPQPRAAAFFTTAVEAPRTSAEAWSALERNPLGAPVQLPAELAHLRGDPNIQRSQSSQHLVNDHPASILERRNNSLTFQVSAPTDGWFVINEAYFPGWLAWVDKTPVPLVRVDGWVRGLKLPAGQHQIQLRFRPLDWILTASIALMIWLGLGALAARFLLKRFL